jgi:hypothetical protein
MFAFRVALTRNAQRYGGINCQSLIFKRFATLAAPAIGAGHQPVQGVVELAYARLE